MFTNWQWIIILIILVIAHIFSQEENNYRDYDCYDKSIYKCGKCRKRCKWHYIEKQAEKLEKGMNGYGK